MNSVDSI